MKGRAGQRDGRATERYVAGKDVERAVKRKLGEK